MQELRGESGMDQHTERTHDAAGGASTAAIGGANGNQVVSASFCGLPEGSELEQTRLALARQPSVVIAEAQQVAEQLMDVVFQQGWARAYGNQRKNESNAEFVNRHHLSIEAWQFLARFFNVAVRVESCDFVEFGPDHGFKAVAAAVRVADQAVLSRAIGMCLTDEPHWCARAKYEWRQGRREQVGDEPVKHAERAAMAQTRACSRALANLFRSVARMAGFSGTPLEETDPEGAHAPEPEPEPQKQPEPAKKGAGKVISNDQARDLWAQCQELHGKDAKAALRSALNQFGFRGTAEVGVDQLSAIHKHVEQWRAN